MKHLPQLILFDGATGSGKSSLLEYLREVHSENVFVGTKLTTRQRRIGDNNWEFRFVERIPEEHARYSFHSVGNQYAINRDELVNAIDRGIVYAVSCVDRHTMEMLSCDFDALTIYVYRSWSDAELEALLALRGTVNRSDSQLRRDEVSSVALQYLEKIELYDHVILNVASKAAMIEQLSKILSLYAILLNGSRRDL